MGLVELIRYIIKLFIEPIPQPDPPNPTPQPTPQPENIIEELFISHNIERLKYGLPKLRLNGQLTTAAKNHTKWMSQHHSMSHTGENNSRPIDRVKASGYSPTAIGENIAQGYSSVPRVMSGWMNSSGHRSNILSNRYSDCGFAMINNYWCAVFGNQFKIHNVNNDVLENYPQSISEKA